MPMHLPFNRWLLAASLANLMLAREFAFLVNSGADAYWSPEIPSITYLGLVSAWVTLTFVGYALFTGADRARSPWLRRACELIIGCCLLWVLWLLRGISNVSVAYPFLSVRHILGDWGEIGNVLKASIFAGILIVLMVRNRTRVRMGARYAISWLSPLMAFTLVKAGWLCLRYEIRQQPRSALGKPIQREHGLIVWMIFDELSEYFSSSDRPKKLRLPALDAFRQTALVGTEAYSPAGMTQVSLASLLHGHFVASAQPQGRFRLNLNFCDGSPPVLFGSLPNFFSDMRELGIPAHLLGWYHPYCRVFGADADDCVPVKGHRDYTSSNWLNTTHILKRIVIGEASAERVHEDTYHDLLSALNRKLDEYTPAAGSRVLFVHWPIPHMPEIARRDAGNYPGELPQTVSYFRNLELTDATLGLIREHLEKAGLWDSALVLVSSDHWWRWDPYFAQSRTPGELAERRRIPFLLKLPHQRKSLVFSEPFSTVVSSPLLTAITKNEVSSPEQAAEWLSSHKVDIAPLLENPPETRLPNPYCLLKLDPSRATASTPH